VASVNPWDRITQPAPTHQDGQNQQRRPRCASTQVNCAYRINPRLMSWLEQPNSSSTAGFQLVVMPSRVLPMIASSAFSTIDAVRGDGVFADPVDRPCIAHRDGQIEPTAV